MRRTEQLQGLRLMKFEEVYGRSYRGELSQVEASEILGVSERTFRRWRDRYQAEGAEGLYDRRLGRASARRAGVDEVLDVLALFDTRYWDFTAKHFWEKLVDEHGVTRSYNWLRTTLQAHGRSWPEAGSRARSKGPRTGRRCNVLTCASSLASRSPRTARSMIRSGARPRRARHIGVHWITACNRPSPYR